MAIPATIPTRGSSGSAGSWRRDGESVPTHERPRMAQEAGREGFAQMEPGVELTLWHHYVGETNDSTDVCAASTPTAGSWHAKLSQM